MSKGFTQNPCPLHVSTRMKSNRDSSPEKVRGSSCGSDYSPAREEQDIIKEANLKLNAIHGKYITKSKSKKD